MAKAAIILLLGVIASIAWVAGHVFIASSPAKQIQARQKEAPVAAAQALNTPPTCTNAVDLQRRMFLMTVTNVSDETLSYTGRGRHAPLMRVDKLMFDGWRKGSAVAMCGNDLDRYELKPGESVTFEKPVGDMLFRSRFYLPFRADEKVTEVFLGEYGK